MSTRSGKRIHSLFNGESVASNGERNTRSKRVKDSDGQKTVSVLNGKNKKRRNYVSYPAEQGCNGLVKDVEDNSRHGTLRKTLKEIDINVTSETGKQVEEKKPVRMTRRTKMIEDLDAAEVTQDPAEPGNVDNEKKVKKPKKKLKATNDIPVSPTVADTVVVVNVVKKSKKKKKGAKKSNSIIVEEISKETQNKRSLNKSNTSLESYHSAAGSPLTNNDESMQDVELAGLSNRSIEQETKCEVQELITSPGNSSNKITSAMLEIYDFETNNRSLDKRKRKSSIKAVAVDKILVKLTPEQKAEILNATFEKSDCDNELALLEAASVPRNSLNPDKNKNNKSLDRKSNRKSSIKGANHTDVEIIERESPVKKADILNTTFDKTDSDVDSESNKELVILERKSKRNSSIKEVNVAAINENIKRQTIETKADIILNTTFEKSGSDIDVESAKAAPELNNSKNSLNTTFEKPIKQSLHKPTSLDSTFDKANVQLDSTFDKIDPQSIQSDSKSSLTTSDEGTVNVTFDKSDENSRISITSDESTAENIMNTTPVLIESSLEESRHSLNTSNTITETTKVNKPESNPPQTPLKREGTFTKDEPEITNTSAVTPTTRVSMPSPGRTPFHSGTKNGMTDKSNLNLTHSIEKQRRRSSLVEPLPRSTRVMFCSPVNNPAVVNLRKSKIIKSNLKGSNKSFVFDESVSECSRPARRKRSYTQNDADDAGAKRKRLADEMQQSVDRLSRPRTSSATPKKPTEPLTPSKRIDTPGKAKSESKVSRAKLPNFAALHQRRFDRMESLDECQERKAKRAKQLLVPTGSLTVLERSSPKGSLTTEPAKPATVKKPETPSKRKPPATEPKPKDGYTRFGFKLNLEVNPFSISTKPTVVKPREVKPNGVLKRQATLPSLVGATSVRREVAKQTIMREKSFTSHSERRDVTRKENRTIIKGVRTNRRFELQMKSRNING